MVFTIAMNTTRNKISKYSLQVFSVKKVFKKFREIKKKCLCQSLILIKMQASRLATSLKKRLWHRYFPVNFAKCLRTAFFAEHLWWLLLNQNKCFDKVSEKLRFQCNVSF